MPPIAFASIPSARDPFAHPCWNARPRIFLRTCPSIRSSRGSGRHTRSAASAPSKKLPNWRRFSCPTDPHSAQAETIWSTAGCSQGSECNDWGTSLSCAHGRRLRRRRRLARRAQRCLLDGHQSLPDSSPESGGLLGPHLVVRRTGNVSRVDRSRGFACCRAGVERILWEPARDARHDPLFLLNGWPAVRLNDARCDPRGSLWIGSMRNNVNADGSSGEAGGQDGILIRVDPDGQATTWRKGVGIANTLAWSPDRRRFYFGDTLANVIWVYDYDASTGAISNERPFLQ